MELSEAFPDTLVSSWSTQPPIYASVDDAFEELQTSRCETVNTKSGETVNTKSGLSPYSLDSVKFVGSFQQHTTEHTNVCNKLEELDTSIRTVLTDLNTMVESSRKVQIFWKKSGLSMEESKTAKDAWDDVEKMFKTHTDHMIKVQQKEMEELRSKQAELEENMAAMRKCVVLGIQMMIPEDKAKKNLCPVCFDNEVNKVLIPCGHTVCAECVTKIGRCCMSCRQPITSKYTVYLSV